MIVGNILILIVVAAMGVADNIHSVAHGKNKPPREYFDPHKPEPPYVGK